MEYRLDQLAQAVARHAPVFHIHPADRYMPCSVEFFMQHSQLVATRPDGGERLLLPLGFVTEEGLLEQQQQHPPPTRLRLQLEPAARTGAPRDCIDDVPLYAHVKEVLAAPGGSGSHSSSHTVLESLEVNYLTFYAYNGAYNVGGVRFVKAGAHDGDWEHITARVHPVTFDLLGMWYNAHRSRDGMWVEGHRVPRTPEGRPIAFVALHGHGVYPMAGTIPRHFFLANDLCRAGGPLWRPHTIVLLPPTHEEHAVLAALGRPVDQPHQPGVHLDRAPAASLAPRASIASVGLSVSSFDSAGAQQGSSVALSEAVIVIQEPPPGGRSSVGEAAKEEANGAGGSREGAGASVLQGPGSAPGGPAEALPAGGLDSRGPAAGDSRGWEGREQVEPADEVPADEGHLLRGAGDPQASGCSTPRTRRLASAHSRGSSLGGSSGSSNGGACGTAGGSSATAGAAGRGVRVVVDDPCRWLFFRGLWGETDAPICQGWFHTAEPPVSRTTLLRLFAHFWPEKRRM